VEVAVASSHVLLGWPKGEPKSGKAAKGPPTVHVRAVSNSLLGIASGAEDWMPRLESLLFACIGEIECAFLSPKVGQSQSDSRIYLHLTRPEDLGLQKLDSPTE